VASLVASSALAVVGGTPASAACGWAYTKQEGKGGVSGSVLARHYFQTDNCWSSTKTSDGAVTLHYTEEVGWTKIQMSVSTSGNSMSKVGPNYIGTANAKAEYCVLGLLGGCSTKETYIKHTLKPGGLVSKTVPSWNL
jgi:hypothetical protein